MFERIERGWRLAMTAFGVLRTDKKLLVFPLLSSIAMVIVCASFLLPLVASDTVRHLFDNNGQNATNAQKIGFFLLAFAFYFCNYFVIVFFNSALVACALMRFSGEEPTLGDGFRASMNRLPQIIAWALVSATVGIILRVIESTSERVGQFIAALLGTAWSIMTYFVVPVLVVEKVGPIEAVKRSCSVLRKTWGEKLVSGIGVGLIMFVLFVVAMVPAFLGAVIGGPALIAGIIITVALVLLLALVSSAVNTIIIAALYQYAAQDRVPQQFDADTLKGAFSSK
ncbi:MAG: hypothetical protein HY040_03895 [Planctomycetes bacterium]|nr:hypothetical protein [Planctomycetota bacterium]